MWKYLLDGSFSGKYGLRTTEIEGKGYCNPPKDKSQSLIHAITSKAGECLIVYVHVCCADDGLMYVMCGCGSWLQSRTLCMLQQNAWSELGRLRMGWVYFHRACPHITYHHIISPSSPYGSSIVFGCQCFMAVRDQSASHRYTLLVPFSLWYPNECGRIWGVACMLV